MESAFLSPALSKCEESLWDLFCCWWTIVFCFCWSHLFLSRAEWWRIGSFPISVCVTFFSIRIEELRAVSSWMSNDCWFPHPLAEFSLVYAGSFPSSSTMDYFSLWVWAVDSPWFWVASWLLRHQTSFGYCCWVVLAMLGPRTTLECGWTWTVLHLLFGIVTRLSLPSS